MRVGKKITCLSHFQDFTFTHKTILKYDKWCISGKDKHSCTIMSVVEIEGPSPRSLRLNEQWKRAA